MSLAQKIAGGLVLIGLVTAATLPGRQTASVIKAAGGAFQGAESTAITGVG
jgi:hypothetical protein